jgi:hypothetical protein
MSSGVQLPPMGAYSHQLSPGLGKLTSMSAAAESHPESGLWPGSSAAATFSQPQYQAACARRDEAARYAAYWPTEGETGLTIHI